MRILLITQGMSPVVIPFFQSHHEIVGIAEDGPRIPLSQFQKVKNKIFSGLSHFVDKKHQNIKQFCNKNKLPYFFIVDNQELKFEEWVIGRKPELIVVYSMSHLLKKTIFSIPSYGTINLHPSYLPKYRGPNPYIWMYFNTDLIAGVTVHFIDEGEDTGDILFQEEIPITIGTSLHELRVKIINEIGINLLLKAVDAIEKKTAPRYSQPRESPTPRARNLSPGEEKILIDWKNWDIKRIWHIVKGYSGVIDFIGLIDRPCPFHSVVIEKYIECPINPGDRGKIGNNPDGSRYISCANGKIFYRSQFFLPMRIKTILNYNKDQR